MPMPSLQGHPSTSPMKSIGRPGVNRAFCRVLPRLSDSQHTGVGIPFSNLGKRFLFLYIFTAKFWEGREVLNSATSRG